MIFIIFTPVPKLVNSKLKKVFNLQISIFYDYNCLHWKKSYTRQIWNYRVRKKTDILAQPINAKSKTLYYVTPFRSRNIIVHTDIYTLINQKRKIYLCSLKTLCVHCLKIYWCFLNDNKIITSNTRAWKVPQSRNKVFWACRKCCIVRKKWP